MRGPGRGGGTVWRGAAGSEQSEPAALHPTVTGGGGGAAASGKGAETVVDLTDLKQEAHQFESPHEAFPDASSGAVAQKANKKLTNVIIGNIGVVGNAAARLRESVVRGRRIVSCVINLSACQWRHARLYTSRRPLRLHFRVRLLRFGCIYSLSAFHFRYLL